MAAGACVAHLNVTVASEYTVPVTQHFIPLSIAYQGSQKYGSFQVSSAGNVETCIIDLNGVGGCQ